MEKLPEGQWTRASIEDGLVLEAGLDIRDFGEDFGEITYRGKTTIVFVANNNEGITVGREGEDDEDLKRLVGGLSKLMGDNPFCKYLFVPEEEGMESFTTYEWVKENREAYFRELGALHWVRNLVRV